MVCRNVARAGRRGFGAFAILAAALSLLAAVPVATAAPSSGTTLAASETVIGLGLKRVSTGKEALAIRGASVGSAITEFDAVAIVPRIPCPGEYQYSLQSENQDTGAQSEYEATAVLSRLGSDRPPCGGESPALAGTLRISVSGDEETIDFGPGRLSGSESFFGDLTLGTQPICGQRYRLAISADLRGRNRSVRYRFRVTNWRSKAMGRKLESDVC